MAVPGVGIEVLSPTGNGPSTVVFTTKYPFAKLDTQLGIDLTKNPVSGPVSFQNISITFKHEPPVAAGSTQTTQIYQFAHGYNYMPTWWCLFQNTIGSNNSAQWTYGNEGSIIVSTLEAFNFAQFIVTVDAKNVTFSVFKSWASALDPAPNIKDFIITIRFYVFTDPILTS